MAKTFTAVIEQDRETGLDAGYIPNITGAHSQGETLEELRENLKEILKLLAEEGEIEENSVFIGIQNIILAV